ncbi:MAG: ribonuclease E/G [Clostridia bacterium]|nr:ribonuclease E/G [Clostridia bacterium]
MCKQFYVNIGSKQSVAILKEDMLTEFSEETNEKFVTDTVIKGKITSIAPSLNAVFVDVGDIKTGYLPITDRKFKLNQEVVLQIRKEKIDDKGVCLSEVINIAGDYVVIGKGKGKCGVSSKITDDLERKRLKDLAHQYQEEGYFIVMRTNAYQESEEIIRKDIEKVYQIFYNIEDQTHNSNTGKVLYKVDGIIKKTLNKYFDPKKDSLITNDLELYHEYFYQYPENRNIKLYSLEYDLYDYYNITAQINTIKYKKVWLKSGGYINIDYTEAMTVIDVNSGKNNSSVLSDDTFLNTNLEAAIECARQITLRNIGGIIVIDFIKSEDKTMQKQILSVFNDRMSEDKLITTIGGFTRLGLFEMIRQKSGGTNR